MGFDNKGLPTPQQQPVSELILTSRRVNISDSYRLRILLRRLNATFPGCDIMLYQPVSLAGPHSLSLYGDLTQCFASCLFYMNTGESPIPPGACDVLWVLLYMRALRTFTIDLSFRLGGGRDQIYLSIYNQSDVFGEYYSFALLFFK